MFDKTGTFFFVFNICCFYTTSVVLMLVSFSYFTTFIFDFQNGIFRNICQKFKLALFLRRQAKFGEDRTNYCVFSIFNSR